MRNALYILALACVSVWTCSSSSSSEVHSSNATTAIPGTTPQNETNPLTPINPTMSEQNSTPDTQKISKSKEEWAQSLTTEEFRVLREHGTERAFTGEFWDHHEEGIYTCAGCGLEMFASATKFNSGTGWPSYYAPYNDENVEISRDASLGMVREEVHCKRCGGHMGHVFDDGPKPTGRRYCINSVSLNFKKK